MADLPEQHALARRLIRACEEQLSSMERLQTKPNAEQISSLQRRVKELKGVLSSADGVVASAYSMPRKQLQEWKRKLDSNKLAVLEIERSFQKIQAKTRRQEQEASDLASLLTGSAPAAGASSLDQDAKAFSNARQARQGAEEMIEQAGAVLAQMGVNRESLKRTQRRLLDIANSVGISDRILKMAERRTKGDAILVYGGMVVITVLVVVVILWWK